MKIFHLLFLVLLSIPIYSQNSFTVKLNSEKHDFPTDIIETDDQSCIISFLRYQQYGYYFANSYFYKFDKNGVLTDSLIFLDNEYACIIRKMGKLDNGNYIAWGSYQKEGFYDDDFWQVEFDENLELIYEIRTATSYGEILQISSTKNEDGNFIITGNFRSHPEVSTRKSFFLKEINQEFEIIRDSIYISGNSNSVHDIAYNSDKNRIYLVTSNNLSKVNYEIMEFSDTFNNVNRTNIYWETETHNATTLNFIHDSMFLYAGNYRPGKDDKDANHYLGVFKYNTDYELQKQFTVTNPDTMYYSGVLNNLDFIDTSNIYFGSFKNYQFGDFWSTEKSFFQIDNLNSNLDLNWEKYYGGDSYYVLYQLKATEDGGALMFGTYYQNEENGVHEKDLVIMKVNPEGLITSTNNNAEIPIKNAIILPNPGREYLELHTGAYPATLQLHNLNGSLVLEEAINSNISRVNTLELSSGTYIWSLVKEGKVVESGKWVRE